MPRQSDKEFLRIARERFAQGQEASHNQRKRVLDDLAFYAGGEKQWDPETLRNRQAQQGVSGMPPVPARPCLTINKVREPVHQVINEERQADMGIQLVPADDWGDLAPAISEDEIELREGLVRRIQRESQAADARTWAFTRAAIAGEGYYRVLTRYVQGKSWEKEVYVARIFNQASVTLDPAHEQADGSDAEWGFIGGDVPWDRYKREYPRNVKGQPNRIVADASDESMFRALGEEYPGWFKTEGEARSARVVEYFYTEWENRTLVKMIDGAGFWEDELPDDLPEDQIVDSREVPQKTIKWAKIDATQVLEETDWEGPDIPIVKVVGEELQPFDTERRCEGMVRPARDAQQGFNAMVSKWVESVGLAPIPPFQIAEGQVEGYEAWYQAANTRTLPYLPYRTHDLEGTQVGPPTRTNVDTPIQAIAASVQMFDEAIKSTTMVPSVQLGQGTDPALKTKGGINALIEQGQLGTSHLLDNLRRSIRYEGQIENNLLYPIYGKPGRLARMLTGENEPQSVRISAQNGNGAAPQAPGPTNGGQPFAQPGQPPIAPPAAPGPPGMVPPPPGAPPMAGMGAPAVGPGGPPPMPPPPPKPPKTYVLTKDANFNVIVKVSRNWENRRDDEASFLSGLIDKNPMFMGWFGDMMLRNTDGPGHEEAADRVEVMLDPKIVQYRASKQQGIPVPPEVTAQLGQLKQQLDQAHQIMGKAQSELKDKTESHQREQETKVRIAQMEHSNAIELQKMKDATQIAVARLAAAKGLLDAAHEDAEEAIALQQKQQHEMATKVLDHAQELDKAQIGHEHAMEAGQQGHQQALEQGAQPPPVNPNQPPAGGQP